MTRKVGMMARAMMQWARGPARPAERSARAGRGATCRTAAASWAGTSSQRDAVRARIILASEQSRSAAAVARQVGVHPRTVERWRARFRRAGMAGLLDPPRPGRPAKFGPVTRLELIALACEPVERRDGITTRPIAALVREAEGRGLVPRISWSSYQRILAAGDVRPHRVRGWLHSPDPQFREKVTAITELYLHPPAGAVSVPSAYPIQLVRIELPPGLIEDGQHAEPDPHGPPLRPPDPPRPSARKPRAAAPAGRPPARRAASTPAALRPPVLGPAVPPLERLGRCPPARQTRDRHPVASRRLLAVLDLEKPTHRPAARPSPPRSERSSDGCPRPTPCGGRRGFTGSSRSWASRSPRRRSPSIWSAIGRRHHRPGGPFSTTTSGASSPWTSSPCPP